MMTFDFLKYLNTQMTFLPEVAGAIAIVSVVLILHHIIAQLLLRSTYISSVFLSACIVKRVHRSSRWLILLLVFLYVVLPFFELSPSANENFRIILRPSIVAVMGWVIVSLLLAIGDWLENRYSWENKKDNLLARGINTQTKILVRSTISLVVLLTFIAIAMTIPAMRNIGISLFASAGVVGLVIGMAARPAIGNLIAGIQIAVTQPIRVDDVVIVENEWGRIEEINLTYVVVRVWDMRRLIVPLSYFMEKPFQNWTHKSSQLVGAVTLYVDYAVSVEPIRKELRHILEHSRLWNRETCELQITDVTEKTVELRALVSAKDASDLFDLRCHVREMLLDYLRRNYSQYLPRSRTEWISVNI